MGSGVGVGGGVVWFGVEPDSDGWGLGLGSGGLFGSGSSPEVFMLVIFFFNLLINGEFSFPPILITFWLNGESLSPVRPLYGSCQILKRLLTRSLS